MIIRFAAVLVLLSSYVFSQTTDIKSTIVDSTSNSNYHLFNVLEDLTADDYYIILDSIKNGLSKDFFKLRMAYTKTSSYNPYDTKVKNTYTEIEKLFDAGNYDAALDSTRNIIKDHFVEAQAHFYMEVAWKLKEMPERAKYHDEMFTNLLNSIYNSGDGRKPETAFIAISPAEEYLFLHWVNLTSDSQELVYKDNFAFDLMHCEDETSGKKYDVYFNISPAINKLEE